MKKIIMLAAATIMFNFTGVANATDCQAQTMQCLQDCITHGSNTKVCRNTCYSQLRVCQGW